MFEKTFSFWRSLVGKAPMAVSVPTEHHERRLWVRYAAELRGNVQIADAADAKVLACVRDLSQGGANLEVERPVKAGQMLTLELATEKSEIRTVLACVVRVQPTAPGKWSLGCVFSRELSTDDLEHFGAQKTQAGNSDQRTWVRYDCALKANYRKVGDPSASSHAAKVLNISANGIGLTVQPALEAGALLNVDLLDRTGRMVRTLLACVVHTTACTGGEFAIGCNFIRELREDELQALLS